MPDTVPAEETIMQTNEIDRPEAAHDPRTDLTRGHDPHSTPMLTDRVRAYVRASKAENTLRGYRTDWRDFCGWCESHGQVPLPAPPETVASFIADRAGRLKPDSIQRRLNAIAEAHKAAGLGSPTHAGIVRNTLKGIRRTLGTTPTQKTPAP